MGATIRDVARKAEVSPSTVSRVFNNKGNISSETKEKVLSVAAELGYQPRSYKKQEEKEKKNIGIIFSKRLSNLILDPFYGQVMAGVEGSLIPYNYKLFFKTISGKVSEDSAVINDLIKDEKIAGLILTGYDIEKDLIFRIKESNIPLVLVDNDLWDENIDCVVNDNIAGARKIVNHLIELGHERIAFFGGPLSHVSLDERYIGYCQALKQAGINKDKELIYCCKPTFNIEDGYNAALDTFKKLKKMPTAVFTANDMLALGVMKAIKELGYKIPDDVSIAGFDDIQVAQHTMPPLTTVRIFKNEMGALAGKRLNELINGINPKPIKLVVSVDTIIRESTAPPAGKSSG